MGMCAAASNEFPILASVGIPCDNPQTVQMLVSELQKLQNKSEILPSGVNTIKSHKFMYVQVPIGPSRTSKHLLACSVSFVLEQIQVGALQANYASTLMYRVG
jgi:hypothetical protein